MTASRATRERSPWEFRVRLWLAAAAALAVHAAIFWTSTPAVFVAAEFGKDDAAPSVDVELVEQAPEPAATPATPAEPEPVVPPEPMPEPAPEPEPMPEPEPPKAEPKPDDVAPKEPERKPEPKPQRIERPKPPVERKPVRQNAAPASTTSGAAVPASTGSVPAGNPAATGSGGTKGGATSKAIATYSPAPSYPAESKAAGEQGTVLIGAGVDATGRITSVSIKKSSGFSRLDRAAQEAMRRHKLKPAMRNGQTIPTVVEKLFRFNLKD